VGSWDHVDGGVDACLLEPGGEKERLVAHSDDAVVELTKFVEVLSPRRS
jgi:hypothetical protein